MTDDRASMKTISVIAVFHNQEEYVDRCLGSITGQTYQNVEIICVDDHSDDDTYDRLLEYGNKQSNIRVLRLEENLSLHISRIRGLKLAEGDYVTFVDGDDCLTKNACEALVREMEKDPVDILAFNVELNICGEVSCEKQKETEEYFLPLEHRLTGDEIFTECFIHENYAFNIWGKAFNTALLKRAFAQLEEIPIFCSEDKYQYLVISHLAESYRSIDDKLYVYSFGQGISTRDNTDLSTFARQCSSAAGAEAAARYAVSNRSKLLQDYMFDYKFGLALFCVNYWTKLTDGCDEGLEILINSFGLPMVTAAFIISFEGSYKLSEEIFSGLKCFQSAPHSIKTVATYYHRLGIGGVERVIADLSGIWTRAGYRVIIFTEEESGPYDYDIPEGVLRVTLPQYDPDDRFALYTRNDILDRTLREYCVDTMIYHAWVADSFLNDLIVCRLDNVGVIVHCHNIFPLCARYSPGKFIRLPQLYSLTDSIVTLTSMDKEFWSIFHDRVYLVNNPMKYTSCEEIPESPLNGKTIIWCQRLSPEKNPLDMIEIFRIVHKSDPGSQLMILGDGDPVIKEQMSILISDYGLSESVKMYGYQRNVAEFYSRADISVITSDVEGFSMGLMESMGAGVPVVMYSLPYLTIVQKKKGIISVEGHDIGKMAEEILGLLKDTERRKQIGKEARACISELLEFDYEDEWKNIFDEVGAGKHIIRRIPMMWNIMFEQIDIGRRRSVSEVSRLEKVIRTEINRRIELEAELHELYVESDRKIEVEIKRRQELEEELHELYVESDRRIEAEIKGRQELGNMCDGSGGTFDERLSLIRNSASFKIGRFITFIPRWIRHIVSGKPM